MFKRASVVIAGILMAAGGVVAQDQTAKPETKQATGAMAVEMPKLMVGDKAPPLKVAKWVKGEPVTGFEKGKTYVVEFWATWCGPCKLSIPHLTELQKANKDVKVIGVSVWENDQTKVEPFAKEQMGEKMDYTVAMDDVPALPDGTEAGTPEAKKFYVANGKMSVSWMKESGMSNVGIPTAFVVNGEGKIAWIGHPMSPEGELDRVLEQVKTGKQDLAKDAAEYRTAMEPKVAKWNEAAAKKKETANSKAKDDEAKAAASLAKLQTAMQEGDTQAQLGAIETILASSPETAKRLRLRDLKYTILVGQVKDYDKAYAYGNELVDGAGKDDAETLNTVAWFIVDPDNKPEKQDLKLAEKASLRAAELSKGKDGEWMILDTVGAVYYAKGDITRAIEYQEKAVKLTPEDGQQADEIKDRLEKYKRAAKAGGS